jgi:hypothetical protein
MICSTHEELKNDVLLVRNVKLRDYAEGVDGRTRSRI